MLFYGVFDEFVGGLLSVMPNLFSELPPSQAGQAHQTKTHQDHGGGFRHLGHVDAYGEIVVVVVGTGAAVVEKENQAGAGCGGGIAHKAHQKVGVDFPFNGFVRIGAVFENFGVIIDAEPKGNDPGIKVKWPGQIGDADNYIGAIVFRAEKLRAVENEIVLVTGLESQERKVRLAASVNAMVLP